MPSDPPEDQAPRVCRATAAGTVSAPRVAWGRRRTIGPWGTTARAVAGVTAITAGVALPHEHPVLDLPGADSTVAGLLIGLVALPVGLTLAVWARGRDAPRLHLGHGAACVVTLLTIGAAQFYPVAVWVGIGASLLLLAAVGRDGCELLAVPNLVLRRNDYLFCLPFSPLDEWDRRRRRSAAAVEYSPPSCASRPGDRE